MMNRPSAVNQLWPPPCTRCRASRPGIAQERAGGRQRVHLPDQAHPVVVVILLHVRLQHEGTGTAAVLHRGLRWHNLLQREQ